MINPKKGVVWKMKIAIIGCGTIANAAHIPSYLNNDEAEIKYFCDIIPERAQAAVEKYGCGTAVEDYHQVLSDPEVEAVSVCTPNNVHPQIAIDALRAGKNVLCEKPAARTYAEALEMQKAQHETGKVLNIGVVNRFNDGVNRIKEYIDQGRLGNIHHVYVSFRAHRSIPGLGGDFTNKAVSGGGVLIDWGVHYLDIVMYCCGDPAIKTVSGETFCKLGKDMKNYVYTDMWAGPPKYDGTYDVDDSVTALIRTFATGDTETAARLLDENYIQHNLAYGTGEAAFLGSVEYLASAPVKTTVNNIRAFEDGDYVFLQTVYNFAGAGEQVAFDIFRFDEDGEIAEHWDNLAPLADQPNPSGRTQIDGAMEITDLDKTEENRQLVKNFLYDVMQGHNPDKTADYFDGDAYLQHNTAIADGVSGLNAALSALAQQGIQMVYDQTHLVLAQGNYVLAVSEGTYGGAPTSYYDLWRVENGKIAEHWDVMETIADPSTWQNQNGKF